MSGNRDYQFNKDFLQHKRHNTDTLQYNSIYIFKLDQFKNENQSMVSYTKIYKILLNKKIKLYRTNNRNLILSYLNYLKLYNIYALGTKEQKD